MAGTRNARNESRGSKIQRLPWFGSSSTKKGSLGTTFLFLGVSRDVGRHVGPLDPKRLMGTLRPPMLRQAKYFTFTRQVTRNTLGVLRAKYACCQQVQERKCATAFATSFSLTLELLGDTSFNTHEMGNFSILVAHQSLQLPLAPPASRDFSLHLVLGPELPVRIGRSTPSF